MGKAKHGFLHLTVVGVRSRRQIARLVVHEDCGDNRLHIASNALPVILKYSGNSLYIGRAGITCDQVLDQLLGDKRWRVGVVEEGVQRCLQITGWVWPASRDGGAKECLLIGGVVVGVCSERQQILPEARPAYTAP